MGHAPVDSEFVFDPFFARARLISLSLRRLLDDLREQFVSRRIALERMWLSTREIKDETSFVDFERKEKVKRKEFSLERFSEFEEIETTVIKYPKSVGGFADSPVTVDCDDQSQSAVIIAFFEIFTHLHLFETFSKHPSKETAEPLEQLFGYEKSGDNKFFSAEKIDFFLKSLRTVLVKKCSQDPENKESQDSDRESTKSENKNFQDCNVNLCFQTCSISDEMSNRELDLEKQKNAVFGNSKANFENCDIEGQQQEKQQYNTKQANDHEKYEDNLMQPSQEPMHERDFGKGPTSTKKYKRKTNKSSNVPQANTTDPLTSKGAANSFPNPKTSTERTDPPTLNGAANSFSNPQTSTESTDPPTSKGTPNSFLNPKTSTESTDPLTSKGAPNSFLNPKTSAESTDPSTSKGAPNSFPNPKISTESTDPLTSKRVPNSFPNPKTSTERTDPSTSKGVPNGFPNPKTSAESTDPLTSKGAAISFLNLKTSTERIDPLTSNGAANSSPQKIDSLTNEIESLKMEKQELLADLGRIMVEETAKENKERKRELFQRVSCSQTKRTVVFTKNDKPEDIRLGSGSPTGFRKPQSITESGDPSVNASDVSTVFQGKDQASTSASIYQDNSKVPNPAMQDSSSITSGEKASGGEGKNESGNVNETSVLASTLKEENLSYSVQQDDSSGREYISLGYIPPRSVATTLYNNYKLLLLSLAERLLSSDIVKLRDWAAQNFAIENAQNARDVLFQLDEKGIINGSDLSALSDFFESIVRFDLVYIIDAFLLGDYSLLRQIPASKKRDANRAQNPQYGSTSRYASVLNTLSSSQASSRGSREAGRYAAISGSLRTNADRNPATSRNPENSNGPQSSVPQQKPQPAFPNISAFSNTNNPKLVSRSPNENQTTAHEQQNPKTIAPGFTEASAVFVDGLVTNERMTTAGNSSTRTTSSNTSSTTNPPVTNNPRKAQTVGSNGLKLSKFQRPDAEQSIVSHVQLPGTSRNRDLDLESNWLCSHYKRVCYVKFECCDKFWPCHRCHNNQSTCGRKKLKSRDTQMLKCVYCNRVQQFGEFCCECGTKFANYFCGLCKHLTGKDDHPYHCEKCGICRIHGDRSFHCDVCGVCLDVQLRGNHKCREGSAHDECCICLEDAFTGCQILPCSHKVHKECATQMIRSGITRCPICRESFAHKLERRPLPNSRKRSGK